MRRISRAWCVQGAPTVGGRDVATHTPFPLYRALSTQAGMFCKAVEIAKAHKAACDAKGLKKVAEFRSRYVRI